MTDVAGKIILDGQEFEVGAPVKTWHEHNMTFDKAPHVQPRQIDPDLIIWHWTGGENGASSCYGTLLNRGLGVTFFIDRDGVAPTDDDPGVPSTIYQYCDPVLWDPKDTGGGMGRRSISLEVANYGFRMRNQPIPRRGRDRVIDEERIHGVKVSCARFYPQQINAIAALTKVLCHTLDIPMAYPREDDGALMLREMPNKLKRTFAGIIGHFNKTTHKFDPGFHLFRELEHLEG
jgi:hypothetical protein